jgi:hypothetical protein
LAETVHAYDHLVYSPKLRPEDQLRTMNTDRKESQSLLNECAEWVAEQLEEENTFIDPGLVSLMMEVERRVGPPRAANQGIAEAIEALLVEEGVQGIPDTINAKLVLAVLQWEDEFMALAGRPRPA